MFIQRQFASTTRQATQRSRRLRKDATDRPVRPAAAAGPERGRLPRRLRRLALALAAVPCALVISAGAASASTPGAQWSPQLPPQKWTGYFGNCTIKSGPVVDPNPTSDGRFAAIGGGQLQCATVHSYRITVQEYYSYTGAPGSYYLTAGATTYSATDYGFTGILETHPVCGTAGYWYTRVTVSAAGYTPALYFDSNPNPHPVAALRCP